MSFLIFSEVYCVRRCKVEIVDGGAFQCLSFEALELLGFELSGFRAFDFELFELFKSQAFKTKCQLRPLSFASKNLSHRVDKAIEW
jgi:hypothetical protein